VFLALTEQIGEDLLAAVAARMRPGMTFRETMEAALHALFDFFSENQGFLWSATADAAVAGHELPSGSPMLEMLARPLTEALSQAIEQGHVSSTFDPELIAHGVNGFVYHSLLYAAKNDLDRDMVLANLLEFLTHAFELSG